MPVPADPKPPGLSSAAILESPGFVSLSHTGQNEGAQTRTPTTLIFGPRLGDVHELSEGDSAGLSE